MKDPATIADGSFKRKSGKENGDERLLRQVKDTFFEKYGTRSSESLESIVRGIARQLGCREYRVVDAIRGLEQRGEIRIRERRVYSSVLNYSLSAYSNWFWAAVIATLISLGLVFSTSGFALYLRYFFGSLLILFLPGYSIVELLYARREENEKRGSNLAMVVALSVGLSLVLAPSIALILNYTSLAIRLIPLTLSLSAITLVSLVIALERKYAQYKLRRYAVEQ